MDLTRRCPVVLPDEIMADEIFARLPAKSVLACRCLSRAWAAALSSDDFIDWYHTLHGGRRKILCLHDQATIDRHAPALPPTGTPLAISAGSFPRFIQMDLDDYYPPVPTLAATLCRGLLILELLPLGLGFNYVCNPSTGQRRALPEGRNTGRPGRRSDWRYEYASLGLGYDVRARRHKVVRIYYRGRDGEGRPAAAGAGCEVLLLNGGSAESWAWRPVCAKPPGWVQRGKNSTFAQGHVYWLANLHHDTSEMAFIASFSVCEETFATVPPPTGMSSRTLHIQYLTELVGRLCLFSWGCPDHGQRYDVWLLRGTAWDLHCRIDAATASPEVIRLLGPRLPGYYLDPHIVPLAIVDDGRRILLAKKEDPDKICAYTPLAGDIENISDFKTLDSSPFEVAAYEESISTLGFGRQDIGLTSSPSTQALSFVLRLLPERTLRRLMCVCRSWCTLIAVDLRYGGPFLKLGLDEENN